MRKCFVIFLALMMAFMTSSAFADLQTEAGEAVFSPAALETDLFKAISVPEAAKGLFDSGSTDTVTISDGTFSIQTADGITLNLNNEEQLIVLTQDFGAQISDFLSMYGENAPNIVTQMVEGGIHMIMYDYWTDTVLLVTVADDVIATIAGDMNNLTDSDILYVSKYFGEGLDCKDGMQAQTYNDTKWVSGNDGKGIFNVTIKNGKVIIVEADNYSQEAADCCNAVLKCLTIN